ncbi:hypothetical protein PINS_up013183 [Pythium insidiosum]|nr:hypothetical protein PINS_up013183 [Pythium insidiosum]
MAYIKNREYSKAEDDCTRALGVDPNHVKCLHRRGTARNALGKHRLALEDFERAARLEPKNKTILSQVVASKELLRTAIKRAPKRAEFKIEVVGESSTAQSDERQGNENSPAVANRDEQQPASTPPVETLSAENKHAVAEVPPTKTRPAARSTTVSILPKLPKKPPTTSYEFARVWKTLAPRGDTDQRRQLLELRAQYLRLIDPGHASVALQELD